MLLFNSNCYRNQDYLPILLSYSVYVKYFITKYSGQIWLGETKMLFTEKVSSAFSMGHIKFCESMVPYVN